MGRKPRVTPGFRVVPGSILSVFWRHPSPTGPRPRSGWGVAALGSSAYPGEEERNVWPRISVDLRNRGDLTLAQVEGILNLRRQIKRLETRIKNYPKALEKLQESLERTRQVEAELLAPAPAKLPVYGVGQPAAEAPAIEETARDAEMTGAELFAAITDEDPLPEEGVI